MDACETPPDSRRALDRLLDHWRLAGRAPRPGNPIVVIDAAEARLGVRLPGDLRAFYRLTDGIEPGTDGAALGFRGVAELAPAPAERMPPLGLWSRPGIGDWYVLAESPARDRRYVIWLGPTRTMEHPVVLSERGRVRRLAGSFLQFLARYLGFGDGEARGASA